MNSSDAGKLARMTTVARSLKEAAASAWSKGHLNEARGLASRAEIAESRARDFEVKKIAEEIGMRDFEVDLVNGGVKWRP
jgi:hypothetical protein